MMMMTVHTDGDMSMNYSEHELGYPEQHSMAGLVRYPRSVA